MVQWAFLHLCSGVLVTTAPVFSHLCLAAVVQKASGQARLTGMTKDKSLNGQLVKVLGVDKDSGRFVVKLADGKMKKARLPTRELPVLFPIHRLQTMRIDMFRSPLHVSRIF